MSTLTKAFVVLNLVFSIAFVTVSATVLAQRTQWRERHANLESAYTAEKGDWGGKEAQYKTMLATDKSEYDKLDNEANLAKAKRDELAAKVTERDLTISELKKKEGEATALAASLNLQVVGKDDQIKRLQVDAEAVKVERDTAKREVDDRKTVEVGLLAQIAGLELKQKGLLDQLASATEQVTDLKAFEDAVERLNPAVASAARDPNKRTRFAGPPIRAAVGAVDVKMGVVVLNVGSATNPPVQKGYRFLVHRGREFIARVEVMQVDKKMCSAEIIDPAPVGPFTVQVGDEAQTE